jgi:quercetin dioxygenase-like cupin family protein
MSEEWTPELDALVAAPAHHALLLENEKVRVLDTRIPPGGRTPVHTHRWPAVLQVMAWSPFVRYDGEGKVMVDSRMAGMTAGPGQVLWSGPLPPHSLENVGTEEIRVLSVEIKP